MSATSLTCIETSPQGRYKKLSELLGSGSFKKVYRGFDTINGRDVAWNEIFVASLPLKERQRFTSEVELLRYLENEHFIKYYSSWYDAEKEKIVLITQIVTSGTLNNYVKGKQLTMELIKRWSVQILEGLKYLHTRDPPIIHRDLKCSNIFIDGKTSTILIGDLGLSKRRMESAQMSIAGTPEFMAPEIFADGTYDEKVDIYAFGMCVLELITKKIPYSECKSIGEIYKKVTGGEYPECLEDVKDAEAKRFIMKLIGKAPSRPTAGELLEDPFLTQITPNDSKFIEVDPKIIDEERQEKEKANRIYATINANNEEHPPAELQQEMESSRGAASPPVENGSLVLNSVENEVSVPVETTEDGQGHSEFKKAESSSLPLVSPPQPSSQPSSLAAEANLEEVIPPPVTTPKHEGIHSDPNLSVFLIRKRHMSLNVSSDIGKEGLSPELGRINAHLITPTRDKQTVNIKHTRLNSSTISNQLLNSLCNSNMGSPVPYVGLQSPKRVTPILLNHSLDSTEMKLIPDMNISGMPNTSDSEIRKEEDKPLGVISSEPNDATVFQPIRIVFDHENESEPATPSSAIEQSSDNDNDYHDAAEVLESITFSILKQVESEFNFRVECTYYKGKNKSQTYSWTLVVRYTYGISKPEDFASDLVSNGFIQEYSLDTISSLFEEWLDSYLINEFKALESAKEIGDVPS